MEDRPFHSSLRNAYLSHQQSVRPYMAEIGLSVGQPKVLYYLMKNGGGIQKELSEFCGVEPATMSRLLESMEKQDLVTRDKLSGDRRCAYIEPTAKGLCLINLFERRCMMIEKIELKGFSDEEKRQFKDYLLRMYNNMETESGKI